MPYFFCPSPIGILTLTQQDDSIIRLDFPGVSMQGAPEPTPLLLEACRQLREYFAGQRRSFQLPLAPQGTPFQQQVWQALAEIPYGETRTYGEIAEAIGRKGASRAVGAANHRNPLPIFIPCHRVIGANGSLTGYAGGLETKRFLLALESGQPAHFPKMSNF